MDKQTTTREGEIREAMLRESPAMRLGERLRRARLNRYITQGEVARGQFSVSYVSAVERGQIRPSLGALEKLAERLQVSVTDLLGSGELPMPSGGSRGGRETRQTQEASAERQREELEERLREAERVGLAGGAVEARQAADALVRLVGQRQLAPRELAHVNEQLAAIYVLLGRGEDARRAAQDGLALAERLVDTDLAERLHARLGDAYALVGSDTLAVEHYTRALESSVQAGAREEVRDPQVHLRALSGLGAAYRRLGQIDEARRQWLQAVEGAAEVSTSARLGPAYWTLAAARARAGDAVEARAFAYKSLAAFEEVANRRLVGAIYERLGRLYQEAGQVEEAVAALRMAHELAAGQQDPRGMGAAERQLAELYLEQERVADAAQAAEQALHAADQVNDARERAQALLMVARVHEAEQRYAEAERSYAEAVELLRAVPLEEAAAVLAEAYAAYSHYLERRGEHERAFAMLKEAYGVNAGAAVRR